MKDLFFHELWESVASLWKKNSEEKGVLTEEERELLEEQFLVRRAVNRSSAKDYDIEKAWKKVEKRTGVSTYRFFHTWRQWAAVGLIGLGAGTAVFYVQRGVENVSPVMVAGEEEQTTQVELILASGERQILGKGVEQVDLRMDGKNALVNADGKQVVYPQSASDTAVVFNVLKVPKGGEYSLSLSDGTVVWLNSESSLRFPVTFGKNSREVYLQGEAFFQVSKDSRRPFHVYSGKQDIRVLGTRFNVSAYPTDAVWHTTLVDGSVMVAEDGNKVQLQPSGQYRIDRETGVTRVEQVDTELYTSWMEGKLYFKNMPVEDIITCLQRWFDLTVVYESNDIRQMRFRGTINKYEPMGQVFRNLEQITDLRFVVNGNTVTAMKAK